MNQRPSLPLAAAEQALNLEIKRVQTVGHLRRTARDISSVLFGVSDETAEVVALQNAFERALTAYCEAMRSPAGALSYTAPDAVRALLTARGVAAQADVNGQQEHNDDDTTFS